jgi:hypothetical protein
MKRSQIVIISVLAVVAAGFVAIGFYAVQPVWLFHWRDFRSANEIVSRVEAFRVNHKRVPDTLHEIGIDDPDLRVFYGKTSDEEYIVWFGTTLGESETYDSKKRKWE